MAVQQSKLDIVIRAVTRQFQSGMKKAQNTTKRLGAQVKGTTVSLRQYQIALAQASAQRFTTMVGTAFVAVDHFNTRLKRAKKLLNSYALTIGLVTASVAGLVYAVVNIVKEFAAFEKQMLYVNTIAKKSRSELSAMSQGVRDLAKAYGVSAISLTKSLYDIYSNLGETGDNMKVLEASAKASVAGFVDVSVAGAAVTGVMNAMKMEVADLDRILNVQFMTIERGKISYEEIAKTSGMFLGTAAAAGQEYGEIMGGFATITKVLGSAERSATSFNAALTLFKDTKFVEEMHDLAVKTGNVGLEVVDATGNFRSYVDVLTALNDELSQVDVYSRQKIMSKLMPSMEARRALDAIFAGFETFIYDTLAQGEKNTKAFSDAFGEMASSTAHDIDKMGSAWADLKLKMGTEFAPELVDSMGWFADVLKHIGGALIALSGRFLYTIGTIKEASEKGEKYLRWWRGKAPTSPEAPWGEELRIRGQEMIEKGVRLQRDIPEPEVPPTAREKIQESLREWSKELNELPPTVVAEGLKVNLEYVKQAFKSETGYSRATGAEYQQYVREYLDEFYATELAAQKEKFKEDVVAMREAGKRLVGEGDAEGTRQAEREAAIRKRMGEMQLDYEKRILTLREGGLRDESVLLAHELQYYQDVLAMLQADYPAAEGVILEIRQRIIDLVERQADIAIRGAEEESRAVAQIEREREQAAAEEKAEAERAAADREREQAKALAEAQAAAAEYKRRLEEQRRALHDNANIEQRRLDLAIARGEVELTDVGRLEKILEIQERLLESLKEARGGTPAEEMLGVEEDIQATIDAIAAEKEKPIKAIQDIIDGSKEQLGLMEKQAKLTKRQGKEYDKTAAMVNHYTGTVLALQVALEDATGEAKELAEAGLKTFDPKLQKWLRQLRAETHAQEIKDKADAERDALLERNKQLYKGTRDALANSIRDGLEQGKGFLDGFAEYLKNKVTDALYKSMADSLLGGGPTGAGGEAGLLGLLGGKQGAEKAGQTAGGAFAQGLAGMDTVTGEAAAGGAGGGGTLGGLFGGGGGMGAGLGKALGWAGLAMGIAGMFSKGGKRAAPAPVQPIGGAGPTYRGMDTGGLYGSDIFQRATFSARNRQNEILREAVTARTEPELVVKILPSREFDAITETKFVRARVLERMRGTPRRTNFNH